MNPPSPPPSRLPPWLDGPGPVTPVMSALREVSADLPASPEQALATRVLAVLQPLRADPEVMAAAALHLWPALREAVPAAALAPSPRLLALLEGLAAADRVRALHHQRQGKGSAEGLRRLLLALVRDLRAVLVLLAIQLVRLREAAALPADERRALVGAVAAALGWRPAPSGLGPAALLILAGTSAFGALGVLLGGTLRAEVVLAVANTVWLALVVAGGIVLSVPALPGPLSIIAAMLPSGALAEGLHTALVAGAAPWAALGLLLAWTLGAGVLAARTLRLS